MLDKDFDLELDAKGLKCPLPLLKAKDTLRSLQSGQILKIIATDPSSVIDFEVFSRQTGHALLNSWQEGSLYCFLLQKH